MTGRIRLSIAASIGTAIVMFALLLGATTASAQIPWNPPCNFMRVNNTLPCPVQFTIVTTPGFLPNPFAIPAGGFILFPPPGPFPNPLTVNGVISFGGIFYPVMPGGPVMPPPAPPVLPCGWIRNVNLGPGGCCADIFFDCRNPPCTVWIVPTAAAPPCRP